MLERFKEIAFRPAEDGGRGAARGAGAVTWTCSTCAAAAGTRPCYPPGPDASCGACGRLLDAQERLASAVVELVKRLAGPVITEEPTAGVEEAAKILKTTSSAVYALHSRGKMPKPIGQGRRLVWRTADLLQCRSRGSFAEKGERS